jgi:ribosomal protein S18 acetylase RimI-like enzyme
VSDSSIIQLTDGSSASVRWARVADAERSIALDVALARDGRGMVLDADQVRTLEQERMRIDALYAGMSAGSASVMLVCEIAREPVIAGTALLQQLAPARCRHVGVLSVGVHPSAQRLGVGRALLRSLIAHARSFGLERLELYVREDNFRARALYASLGFEHEGTRRRFVRLADGSFVDDLILTICPLRAE